MITVLMSVYKERPDDLRKAIESVLHQTLTQFEFLIILDEPSNRELEQIIRQYAQDDGRIRFLINERNRGLIFSLNRGLAEAQGDYIARMDADDMCERTRLARQWDYLQSHPETVLVSTNRIEIDEQDNVLVYSRHLPTDEETIRKLMRYENCIYHPSVMFCKDAVQTLGGYRDFYAAEDYDLWLRMLSAGMHVGIIDEYLLRYRIGSTSLSQNNAMVQRYTTKYIRKLYDRRRQGKEERFSQKALAAYLARHCSPRRIRRYNSASRLYLMAWRELKEGRRLAALGHYIGAVFCHGEILWRTADLLRAKKCYRG